MNIASNSKKRRRLEFEDKGDEIGTDGNSVEVEDTGPLLVVDEAISITLIASEIFRCLSHQDLLNCSLVNKTWNVSARFALREDRQSCVRLGGRGWQMRFPCEELTLFYNLISKSWSHPFNGFSFTFSYANQGSTDSVDHICPSTDKSEPSISSVIQQLRLKINIKYLRICITQTPTYICPVAIFMADIIRNPDLSKNLLGLLIDRLPDIPKVRSNLPGAMWSFPVIRDFFTFFTGSANSSKSPMLFPNLKFLKLPDCITMWGYTCPINRILKQLLLASPKVTDLRGYIPLDIFQTVAQLPVTRNWVLQNLNLEIMSDIVLEIMSAEEGNEDGVVGDVDQMLDLMLTFVDEHSIIKIQNLTVKADSLVEYLKTEQYFDYGDSDIARLRNLRAKVIMVSTRLLECSCEYIRSLKINSIELLPVLFKHYYDESEISSPALSLKLNQLSHLTIESSYRAEGALESLVTLSSYGFEFFCPYLKSVELVWKRPDDYERIDMYLLPPGNDFIFPTSSCSTTVTKFEISVGYGYSDVNMMEIISKCGELFPNVKSFVADMYRSMEDVELYFEALWRAWPGLESIHLKKLSPIQKNWDYLFTGLSRRDCTRFFRPWKIWTDEQFKKLQKAHSLLDFTKLKHLEFQINNHWKCEEEKRQRPQRLSRVFLSKLTGHFIFRRMPQLKVHILRTCCDSRATETNPVKCRFKLKHLRKYVQFDPAN